MTRPVVWSGEARSNLVAIRDYIGQFNPLAAQRLANRLVALVDSLDEFSERGRLAGRGLRELTAVWPYIIRYRVTQDTVIILRIRHGAQEPD